jgi:two-component system chemotaxis sensor kinase CheA
LVETAFRAAHSLKGAARAVNLTNIEAVCQSLESVFAALKRQSLAFSEALFELLYETVDLLSQLLAADLAGESADITPGAVALIQRLEQAAHVSPLSAGSGPPAPLRDVPVPDGAAATATPPAVNAGESGPLVMPETLADRTDTIRITKARLDALLLQAEELLAVKLAAGQFATEMRELRAQAAEWERQWAKALPEVRRTSQRLRKRSGLVLSLDDAAQLLNFLNWNQDFIRALQYRVAGLANAAAREQRVTASLVDNLIADVRRRCCCPLARCWKAFPNWCAIWPVHKASRRGWSLPGPKLKLTAACSKRSRTRCCISFAIASTTAWKRRPPVYSKANLNAAR